MNDKINDNKMNKLIKFLNNGDKPMSEFFMNMKKFNKNPDIYRSTTFIFNSINREYTKYYISLEAYYILYDESKPKNRWSLITSDDPDDYPDENLCQGCVGHGLDQSFCINPGNKFLCDICKICI